MSLRILQIEAGEMKNFSYLIIDPESRKAIAVDPSFAPEALLEAAKNEGVEIETLVNTHGHRDHCAGNEEILSHSRAILAGHPADIPLAQIPLQDESHLRLGQTDIHILHCPGHTPGSIVLNPPGALITGDTLFVGRVGRADLVGSDPAQLYRSLKRLAAFAPETLVYPGHDYGPRKVSTLAFELENNPFLQCPDLESFIRLRMG